MMAPCDIEFIHNQPHNIPCSWIPAEYRYIVCLGCVEGIEIRYCDGTAEYQYKICTEHQTELNAGVTYDQDFLDWVRKSLQDGTLKKPIVKSPQKPAVTLNRSAVQIQRGKEIEEIKAWWPESAEGKDWHTDEFKPEELDILRQSLAGKPWPRELIRKYSHIDDCNYGIHPSYVVAPLSVIAAFNEDVLKDRENLYWYGCESCVRETLSEPPKLETENTLIVKRDPITHKPSDYAHCSECVAIMNRHREEAFYVPDALKMIFFKRCNYEYLNALGYRIELKCQSALGAPKYYPPNADFTYTALKSREEMVVIDSVDDENLVRFAWLRNQEYAQKKAASERMQQELQRREEIERKKTEFMPRSKRGSV